MGEGYPSETFRVLKNNEEREFGEYRTRRLVLEAWDRVEPQLAIGPALAAVPNGAWATPTGVAPENLALFALVDVLRHMAGPVEPERVRLAAILVRKPALALALLRDTERADWIRVIGPEARPLPKNVVEISRFQRTASDPAWAAAVAQLQGTDALVTDPTTGRWSAGARLPSSSGQEWVAARVSVATRLLALIDLAQAEQHLATFVRGVAVGAAE